MSMAPAPLRAVAVVAWLGLLAGAVAWTAVALPYYATKRALSVVLVALLLQACAQPYDMGPFPKQMYIAPDVDPKVAEAYRGAAQRWNKAQGSTVFVEVDRPTKCGVRVIRDERAQWQGLTTPVAQCRLTTRLRADLPDDRKLEVATHELGHTVVLDSHNPDDRSVMRDGSMVGSVITLDDIETMRSALPEVMLGRVGTAEAWPHVEPAL